MSGSVCVRERDIEEMEKEDDWGRQEMKKGEREVEIFNSNVSRDDISCHSFMYNF